MKQLKRSECAILPLVLKGKWYDMIDFGVKKEEYRDFKPHWTSRVLNWIERSIYNKSKVVGFSLGYKKADVFYTVRGVHRAGGSIHPEWGEPETPHYVIQLGERVKLVD